MLRLLKLIKNHFKPINHCHKRCRRTGPYFLLISILNYIEMIRIHFKKKWFSRKEKNGKTRRFSLKDIFISNIIDVLLEILLKGLKCIIFFLGGFCFIDGTTIIFSSRESDQDFKKNLLTIPPISVGIVESSPNLSWVAETHKFICNYILAFLKMSAKDIFKKR